MEARTAPTGPLQAEKKGTSRARRRLFERFGGQNGRIFYNPNEPFARLSCGGITEFWGISRANWSNFEPKRAVCSFELWHRRVLGGFPHRSCSDKNQVSAYPSSLPIRPTCTEPPGSPRGSLSRQRKRGSRRKQCEYEASAIHCFVLGSKNAEG